MLSDSSLLYEISEEDNPSICKVESKINEKRLSQSIPKRKCIVNENVTKSESMAPTLRTLRDKPKEIIEKVNTLETNSIAEDINISQESIQIESVVKSESSK
jgi:hypothetical protein